MSKHTWHLHFTLQTEQQLAWHVSHSCNLYSCIGRILKYTSRWGTSIPGTCNVDLAVPAARSLVVAAPVISFAPPIPRFRGSSPYAPKSCVCEPTSSFGSCPSSCCDSCGKMLSISARSSRLKLSMSCVHLGNACPAHPTEDENGLHTF